jgi:hypothetical protein
MSRLEKITGSLQNYQESIIILGDRNKNKRPVSSEMINDFMLLRANEMLDFLSSDLNCNSLIRGDTPSEPSDWFNGIPCEILKPDRGWEKGKITLRITADFISDSNLDTSEEINPYAVNLSLDEIRNSIEAT